MGFIIPAFTAFFSTTIGGIIGGAIVATAFSTLIGIIFAPKQPRSGDQFEATPFTRRVAAGSTPFVFGRRKSYGIEVLRENDSNVKGASSRQFYLIIYSIGAVHQIYDTRVFSEKNIFELGHVVKDDDGDAVLRSNSSIIAYLPGTLNQSATGFGWRNLDTVSDADVQNNYDSLGLQITADNPHPVAYRGRAGINLFLAADSAGRNFGNSIAVDSIVEGILCRRFKNASGEYLCHVNDHNKFFEFRHDSKHYTGTVAAGTYTATQLATAVTTAFNAATDDSASGHAITFTISYASGTGLFTIASDTSGVILLTWTGAHRDEDIYPELGLLRGARYSFNPKTSGGNAFQDLQLTGGSAPYEIESYHTGESADEQKAFTKAYTRNPIRICYEMRTNRKTSPGVEHFNDFDQSAMLTEEKYCDEIVEVDSVTQYDICPRNVFDLFEHQVGSTSATKIVFDSDGTSASKNSLLALADGSTSDEVELFNVTSGLTPQIVIDILSPQHRVFDVKIYTNHSDQQTYTVQILKTSPDTWVDIGTVTNGTGTQTLSWNANSLPVPFGSKKIRIMNFSRSAGGAFAISEIEVIIGGLYNILRDPSVNNSRNSAIQAVDTIVSGNLNALADGVKTTDISFGSVTSGASISTTFPFPRTIGRINVFTNTIEPQDFDIEYKETSGGSWTSIPTVGSQTGVEGNASISFTPISMVAFRITNFARGASSVRAFSITELQAFDAIPSRRYTLDLEIQSGNRFSQILSEVYKNFFGIASGSSGKKILRVERDESPVQELNEKHIVSFQKLPMPRREKVGQWRFAYHDELKDYEKDTYIHSDFGAQLRTHKYPGGGTGNITTSREIEFVGVTRPAQIRRMANVIANRASYSDNTYVIDCLAGSVIAREGQIVRLNYLQKRISNKLARISRYTLRADYSVQLELTEHIAEVYDDIAIDLNQESNSNRVGGGNGNISAYSEYRIPANVRGALTETPDITTGGVSVPQLKVNFIPPNDPNYSHANVYVALNGEENADSDPVFRFERSIYPSDTTRGILLDTEAQTTVLSGQVLIQSVSKTGISRDIYSIYEQSLTGRNTAVSGFIIPLTTEQGYMAAYRGQIASSASSGMKKQVFDGDNTTTVFTLDQDYQTGSLLISVPGVVDRLHIDDSDTSAVHDRFKYTETDTNEITLNMAIPTGSKMIVYYVQKV